jgi:hypothetical protein
MDWQLNGFTNPNNVAFGHSDSGVFDNAVTIAVCEVSSVHSGRVKAVVNLLK